MDFFQFLARVNQNDVGKRIEKNKPMKPIFFALSLSVLLFSCSKEEVTPTAPGVTTTVHVEYRVTAVSGHVIVNQLVPFQGATVDQQVEVNRSTYAYKFDATSGTALRISAKNTDFGPEEVIAEIYVNDVLFTSGSANAHGATALAEGVAQ